MSARSLRALEEHEVVWETYFTCLQNLGRLNRINTGSETDHSNQKPGWDVRIGNHTTPNPKPVNHESETEQPRIGNHGIHVGTSFNVTDAEPTI